MSSSRVNVLGFGGLRIIVIAMALKTDSDHGEDRKRNERSSPISKRGFSLELITSSCRVHKVRAPSAFQFRVSAKLVVSKLVLLLPTEWPLR
jgi:hypothetical protein